MTFEELVKSCRKTCGSCPTQWEGDLHDGRRFYFRYRHGVARLGVGVDDAEAIEDSRGTYLTYREDPYDGQVTDEQFRALMLPLWLLRENP